MIKFWHKHLSNISDTATIGDHSIIHSHVWIGDRVSIGKHCRVQAFAFIPTGVRIADNVFIGPHVCFTNDRHPPSENWEITIVNEGARVGAGAVILPGVTLGKNCMVGAGSLVVCDIPEGETWVGNPAKKHGN